MKNKIRNLGREWPNLLSIVLSVITPSVVIPIVAAPAGDTDWK
jgi:hypothetical protein